VDITHTHTSNVLAFGGNGSTTRRVSFSMWIACKLHADPMIPQKPPKSTFPVKIFRQNLFYFLINANPTISPNFMVIGQFLFFGLFGIAPPNNTTAVTKKCNQSYWQMQVATFTKKSTLIDITYTVTENPLPSQGLADLSIHTKNTIDTDAYTYSLSKKGRRLPYV
jgi:hypothetical protein